MLHKMNAEHAYQTNIAACRSQHKPDETIASTSAPNEPEESSSESLEELARSSSYEPSTSGAKVQQTVRDEVQQLAEPKALRAEAASQEKVKQYADLLAEEYE